MIGTRGSFEFGSLKPRVGEFTGKISWYDDYSSDNTSRPTIESLQFKSPSWGTGFWVNGTISIDGVPAITFDEFAGTHQVTIVKNGGYASVVPTEGNPASPWVGSAVTHNTDGSKSVVISAELKIRSFGGGVIANFSASETATLTTIPRASTVGAANGDIESVATISINRRSDSYTHTLHYQFGNVSGYINADGQPVSSPVKMTNASIPFHIPTTFYSQIPNSQSAACTITCRTYSGDTQVGDAQQTAFMATCNSVLCRPGLTGNVEDTNQDTVVVTGNAGVMVRFMSKPYAVVRGTAKNGATITKSFINDIETGSNYIDSEDGVVNYRVVDSRGFSNSLTKTLSVIPYIKLTSNPEYNRPSQTGSEVNLTVSGQYFGGSFGVVDNYLNVWVEVDGVGKDMDTVSKTSTGYSASVKLNLPYNETHSVMIVVRDRLMSADKTITISGGMPHWAMGSDYFAFRQLLKPEGGLSDIYIYINNDPSRDFVTELESKFSKMRNCSMRVITFSDYPNDGSGGTFIGFLMKTSDKWGVLVGWNYFGQKLYRFKQDGVWKGWNIGGM